MDFPAIPADPRDVAREDRQEPDGAGVGLAGAQPALVGSKGNAAESRGLGVGEPAAKLQGPKGGQIGAKALGEKLGFRPVLMRPGGGSTLSVYCA